jgi:NAD(P) transhydrogenase subunit alpha
MPADASKMFGNNIINLLKIMVSKEGGVVPDMSDEIIKGTTAVHAKEYISPRVIQILELKQTV